MAKKGNAKTAAVRPATKSAVYATIAERTGLSRKQVSAVFDQLSQLASEQLKQGPGTFTVPGLFKLKVVHKPATPGGMRPNPFRPGEMMEVKPKPARKVVRAAPLKALKDMVK